MLRDRERPFISGRSGEGAALPNTFTVANSWVMSVDGGQRRTPGWLALVISVLTVALAMLVGPAVDDRIAGFEPARAPAYGAVLADRLWADACILTPLLVVAAVMVRAVERRPALRATVAPAAAASLGAAGGVVAFLLALSLCAAFGGVTRGADSSPFGHRLLGAALSAPIIVLQAGAEEYFFRGWLQPVLAARWGPWVGLAAASILFAAAHTLGRPIGALAVLNDTLAGVAFGVLALRTGGLVAPIAAHWGWNWTEQGVAGATPNPGVDPLGSLFDLDLRGPRLLSGGVDEMNGSICATVAILLLIFLAVKIKTEFNRKSP